MRIIRSRQYHKLIRALSFMLIVALLLSGCVGPGDTTEPGKPTDKPSSEQGTSTPSEVVIRTLADQQSEWTEGQFYPGAYQRGSTTFTLPAEPTTFVQEAEGILYAYGSVSESGRFAHQVRRLQGIQKKDMLLSEIPEDYRLSGMAVGKDTLFLLAYPTESASETVYLLELFIYTSEGIFQSRQKLTDLLDSDQIVATSVTAFTDLDGSLWIRVPEEGKLYCVRPDGRLDRIVAIPTDFQGGFMRGRNADELVAVLGTGTGLVFGKMNTKTGASENYTVEGLPGILSVFPGTMYDALVMTGKNVYGVNLGEPVVVKELFVFTDLGIDGTVLRSMEDHEDGSLSAILLERVKTEGEKISLIPRTTKVREGLTLACLKENDYIKYAVNQYNQANPDNKIIIKEYFDKYAVDTTEEDALNRLNSDLMDGTAGDIVCLDGISFAGGTRAFLESGIFLDLYKLMDNDPEFNKEDYFTDVFRINETDGKLYRLVPFFSLNTKFGKVDDVGETTHIDESLLWETEPVESLFGPLYRRKEFIHDLLVFSLGDLQNREAAIYDTAELARYIEVAGKLPDFEYVSAEDGGPSKGEVEASGRQGPNDHRDGIIRFFFYGLHQEDAYFRMIRNASAVFGEPGLPSKEGSSLSEAFRVHRTFHVKAAYSGFPVKEGCGSALINRFSLAIPASSEVQEEAWHFLKSTLSEKYQSTKKLFSDGIPVNKNVFQENVVKLKEYTQDYDPAFLQGALGGDLSGGASSIYWTPATEQWMVDSLIRLLGDITLVDEVDPYVEAIVTEEITKYCDGRQTAEEAARNIAERVELYRDEQ